MSYVSRFKYLSGGGSKSLNYFPFIVDGVMTLEGTSRALEFLGMNTHYNDCPSTLMGSWQELSTTPGSSIREMAEDAETPASSSRQPAHPTRKRCRTIEISLDARAATSSSEGSGSSDDELTRYLERRRLCVALIRVPGAGLLALSSARARK